MRIRHFFDPKSRTSFNQYFRKKRFAFFSKILSDAKLLKGQKLKILDIGGTPDFWQIRNFSNQNVHITLLNLERYEVFTNNFTSVKGDACNLSEFKDKEFDLVFSNSVIEHLFTWENQMKMATEARRVGKSYFIQTPNFYCPIEPHWMFPFFQFLPFSVRVLLTANFSLGHIVKAANREQAREKVREVRLLTISEMKKLFQDGKVFREKVLGITKSITMYQINPHRGAVETFENPVEIYV